MPKMMRIGIDARLNAYRQGGIPQYTRRLLAALIEVAPAETFVALQHVRQRTPLVEGMRVLRRRMLTPPHHRLEQVTLPLELLPLRLDLLHCPDFIPPLRRTCPAVITVHDLAFLRFPEILDENAARYYGQIHAAVRSAEAIIAVSEATRRDMATLLGIDTGGIDVIAEAADPALTPLAVVPGEQRLVGGRTLAAGTFLLCVGTLEPRKNLPLLLEALRVCINRRPQAGYRLVLAGARGWRDEGIFQTLSNLNLGNYVELTGGVGSEDLRWLYSACRLFALPSRYEGFGLTLLEAMACGAPALAADTSSLPEVAGDAAILLPPDDILAWADTIEALWDNEEGRQALAIRGQARAAQFSWERTARETLAVYRRVVGRNA